MIDEDKALKHAFNLIKQGNYQEASLLLSRLDSSIAEEWLQRVSEKVSEARQGLVRDSSDMLIGAIPGDTGLVISHVEPRNWGVWAGISGVIGLVVSFVLATGFAFLMLVIFNAGEYMLVLAPAVAALFGSIFVRLYMTLFRVNTAFWVAFLALFFGAMTYGMYWQLHYLNYPLNSPERMSIEAFDTLLIAETGQTGALGFIQYAADLGQPVVRGQVLDFFDEFSPAMNAEESQIYWLVELLILLLIPILITRGIVKHRVPRIKRTSSLRQLLDSVDIDPIQTIKSNAYDDIHQR